MENQNLEKVFQVGELTIAYKRNFNILSPKLTSSFDAFEILNELFEKDELHYRESFWALYTSRCNEVIAVFKVSTGGVSGTVVDSKVLFSQALLCGASGLIIAHNHPSGNSNPSEQDIRLTKNIVAAGKVLEIAVLDHLILYKDTYMSFADSGYMP